MKHIIWFQVQWINSLNFGNRLHSAVDQICIPYLSWNENLQFFCSWTSCPMPVNCCPWTTHLWQESARKDSWIVPVSSFKQGWGKSYLLLEPAFNCLLFNIILTPFWINYLQTFISKQAAKETKIVQYSDAHQACKRCWLLVEEGITVCHSLSKKKTEKRDLQAEWWTLLTPKKNQGPKNKHIHNI